MEDPNSEVMIGNVQVYLQSLAYMIEMNEQLDIVDYKGQAVGHLNVAVSKNQQRTSSYSKEQWTYGPTDLFPIPGLHDRDG